MKYKVGDKVKIVSLQSVDRGYCMDVVGDIVEIIKYDSSDILKYKVKIEDGGRWWWEESNLELIEDVKPNTIKEETEMNATKVENTTPKFKKGDKVVRVGDTLALGVELGEVYTVDNPSSHSSSYGGELHNHVTLVEVESTPSDKYLELYNHVILEEVESMPIDNHLVLCIEKRNYREMSPNDLITISINGVESEVPLGDIVHAVAILGITNGYHGARIWDALRKPFDPEGFVGDMDTVVEFRDKQKEALEYFFQPCYDKQQQEKDELKTLIASKMEEVDSLVKQLNQM